MKKSSFYVTLSSGACNDIFPNNTASNFKVKLGETINLAPVSTHWECAVVAMHVPANYFNINDYCRSLLVKKSKSLKVGSHPEYRTPRYVYNTYEIPHDVESFTIAEFVRHVNNSMNVDDYPHFKLELLTVAELNKESQTPNKPGDENKYVLNFRIGKDSRFYFNVSGLDFWRDHFDIPESLVGQEIHQTFTVPVPAEEIHSKIIHISHNIRFRVYKREGFDTHLVPIPEILPEDEVFRIKLNIGSYRNANMLIKELQSGIDKMVIEKDSAGVKKDVFRLTLNNENSLTIEILDHHYSFQFTDDLAYALGFEKNKWYETAENKALLPIDLHYNLNTVYVYSDVVAPSIVSTIKASILAILPVKSKADARIIAHYFPRLFYYPVNNTTINEIEVAMAGDFGKQIPFVGRIETTMKLHFRVYKD